MRRAFTWALVLLCALSLGAVAPPGDPLVGDQWYLPHVGTFDAWEVGQGASVVIAVVDTGVDRSHPELAGRVAGGIDLVEPGTPPDDPNGHGTLVAGVIAANAGNGIGGTGVAPATSIMPVRVLGSNGSGSSTDVAEGIRWAARNGADIINLSLAESPGLVIGAQGVISAEVEEAIAEAHAAGALVVAAAGNEGRASIPYSPAAPLVIVGASDRSDRIWAQSNRDERTLFAPGVEIVSTYTGHGYARADGTSFATPIVSAGAAVLRGAGLGPDQIRQRLYATAAPMAGSRGRVDLAAATAGVTAAGPAPPPPPVTQPPPTFEPAVPAQSVPAVPEPEPRPMAEPRRLPDPAPPPSPSAPPAPADATPRERPDPAPETTDVVLGLPASSPEPAARGGAGPTALAASLAVLLVVANVTAHVTYAGASRSGPPQVVWRRRDR